MISIIINLLLIFIIISRYCRNKSTFVIFLMSTLLTPRIPCGGSKIDGVYLITICVAITILIKRNGHISKLKGWFSKYSILLIGVHCLYLFSWLLFNRNGGGVLLTAIVGAIKIILIMWEVYECNRNISINIKQEVVTFIMFVLVINIFAVGFEMINYQAAVSFLSDVFLNDTEIWYLNETVKWGKFARYYGLFPYPMHMGLFMCYSIAYLLMVEGESKLKKSLLIIGALVLGMYSGSKSFIIGTAVIFISYIFLEVGAQKISKKQIASIASSLLVVMFVVVFYDYIYDFILNVMGPSYARYFSFLKNVGEIMVTRFDSTDGALISTIEVIKDYWIFGVGPDSLVGEPVMDNAYIVLIHNGGIIALGFVLQFYIQLLIKSKKRIDLLLLIIALLATGMGFQTIFSTDTSLWIMITVFGELDSCFATMKVKSYIPIKGEKYIDKSVIC